MGVALVQRAYACPLEVMEALSAAAAERFQQLQQQRAPWHVQYAWSREWLYRELLFVAVLRTHEGLSARFAPCSFRPSPGRPTHMEFYVPPAVTVPIGGGKNYQTWGIWVPFPLCGPGKLQFQASLARHEVLLAERGFAVGVDLPLFGMQFAPRVQLSSVRVLFGPEFRARVIAPALHAAGCADKIDLRWTPYSFRRGGINIIYAAARAAGLRKMDLIIVLMEAGRWRSLASLMVYLMEIDSELANVFRLLCKASGRHLDLFNAAPDSDDEEPEREQPPAAAAASSARAQGAPSRSIQQLWAQASSA